MNSRVKLREIGSLSLVLWLLAIAGCQPLPNAHRVVCPAPPIPECKPGSFNETLLDTTFPGPGKLYHSIKLLPAAINSEASDYAVMLVPAGSGRSVTLITSDRLTANSEEREGSAQKMFFADFKGVMSYGDVEEVPLDQTPLPYGSGSYSSSDNLLYFAAKANNHDPIDFDIYKATVAITGDRIRLRDVKAVTALNMQDHFDSHPALTPDGKTIYFTSDRHGGVGGTDIWYATRNSTSTDNWSTPQPLGSTINTLCDEITPFVNTAGRMIFASNGHSTVGGYDLFESKPAGSSWDIVQNLGRPINTEADEFFPNAATDSTFYYASDQNAGIGGVNLFVLTRRLTPDPRAIAEKKRTAEEDARFRALEEAARERSRQDSIRNAALQQERARLYRTPATISGQITRGANQYPAEGADLFVRDNKTQEELHRETLGKDGRFSIDLQKGKVYDIGAESEESFYAVQTIDLMNSLDTALSLSLNLPDTLVLRINFPFDDYSNPYEFTIGDDGERLPLSWQNSLDLVARSAQRSLAKLREVVVIGHTDSMGTDEYNEKLGERRAQFIKNELIKRGIAESMLRIETRGRRQPVARRPTEDDEIFRLRNRRAEFVKVFK